MDRYGVTEGFACARGHERARTNRRSRRREGGEGRAGLGVRRLDAALPRLVGLAAPLLDGLPGRSMESGLKPPHSKSSRPPRSRRQHPISAPTFFALARDRRAAILWPEGGALPRGVRSPCLLPLELRICFPERCVGELATCLSRMRLFVCEMMPIIRLVGLVVVSLCASGCVSAWIVEGGKHYQQLSSRRSTVQKVRNCLGEPAWIRAYPAPMAISNTTEFLSWQASHPQGYLFVWGVDDESRNSLCSICEVYRIHGPLADSERGTVYFMAVGMTFLVGELFDPFCIPSAIRWRRQHANDTSWLTYWYDSEGRYVGYFRGDIREGADRSTGQSTEVPEKR